jgi:PAS domain S-box-containing protein
MTKRRSRASSRSRGPARTQTAPLVKSLPPQEALRHLAAIINSSDDAIVSKDLDGIITSWNPAAERMFGYVAAEAVGKSITLIIPKERLGEEHEVLRRVRIGEALDHYETVRVRKDGTPIDISLTVSPIRNASGTIVGASKIARDISDRKRADAERSMLLAREQSARSDAERATRTKDEFLATLSHELRTPLTAIVGWVRMLRQGGLDDASTGRALEVVDRNTAALKRLVEDILDISSITMGQFRIETAPVDLAGVVEQATDSVRHAALAKDITLNVTRDPVMRPVVGDAGRLQQVVWNLLSNAVKFTPAGGRIDVTLAQTGSYAEIRVRDTGQGIAPEFVPRLFDRFSQQDASTTRQHGGLGMGLAIVRHLVELHGGVVRAESAGPDQGATFIVRLPQALARVSTPDAASSITPAVLAGIRVLAVEDEADTRDLITLILRQAGAEVALAASVEEALRASTTPDIVLCDLSMPVRDGFDLLREARSRPGPLSRAPFVALTAHAQEPERRRTAAEGFVRHVVKPLDAAQLIEIVRTVSRR